MPLAEAVEGLSAFDPPRAWTAMRRALRNLGRPGVCATAMSAVDLALWDLEAKLHGLPLAALTRSWALGRNSSTIPCR